MVEVKHATDSDLELWSKTRTNLFPDYSSEQHLGELKNLKAICKYECWLAFEDE